jgi:NTE family protein
MKTPIRFAAGAPAAPRLRDWDAAAPRLALVVGSGGVRSMAAVGVADVLRQAGIGIDLVVGCSSGALFGACIAAGMSSEQSLHSATRLWSAELTEQRRWRAWAELLVPRWAGFGDDFAMRDDRLIVQRLRQAFGDARIESLPIALRVAATDAASGQALVLRQGGLVDALRASMAVPFIFPSVAVQGRRLVDGVISDPLPIAAAADAGVVVALGFEGRMPRRVDRASRLVAQATTALTNNLQQARLDAARASGRPLVCIELDLQRPVGLWETRALPHVFEAGRQAARLQLPALQKLLAAPVARRAA